MHEIVFKFVAELFDDADGGHRGGVAQRAEGAAQHVFGKVADHNDVALRACSLDESGEQLFEPGGAFAAGDAPAAAFVLVEAHNAEGDADHVGIFIEDDHAAAAEHALYFGERIVIERETVAFGGGEHGAGTAAGDYRLQLFAIAHAASKLFNSAHHGEAEGHFVNAGLVDVAADAQHFGATAFRDAESSVGSAPHEQDGRHRAEGFDVVEERGRLVCAGDGRERRSDSRDAALAFEAFEEGGFFTAFVGSSACVGSDMKAEVSAQDLVAQKPAFVGFGDGLIHDVDEIAILTANVNPAVLRTHDEAANHHAFEERMGVELHEQAVFAGAGFGFIGVDDDVFRLGAGAGDEAPFEACREASTATTAQVRSLEFVDDGVRGHAHRLLDGVVAFVREIG